PGGGWPPRGGGGGRPVGRWGGCHARGARRCGIRVALLRALRGRPVIGTCERTASRVSEAEGRTDQPSSARYGRPSGRRRLAPRTAVILSPPPEVLVGQEGCVGGLLRKGGAREES